VTTNSFKNQMLHTWCALLYVVGILVGLVLIARFIPPPPAYFTAEQVATLYQENMMSIRIGLFFAMAFTSLLAPFSAAIAVQMMRRESSRPVYLAWTDWLLDTDHQLRTLVLRDVCYAQACHSTGLRRVVKDLSEARAYGQ
jgi:hypothetical protein